MFPIEFTTVNIGADALAVVQTISTQSLALVEARFPVVVVLMLLPMMIFCPVV